MADYYIHRLLDLKCIQDGGVGVNIIIVDGIRLGGEPT